MLHIGIGDVFDDRPGGTRSAVATAARVDPCRRLRHPAGTGILGRKASAG
jgi:hypothetical protein